MTLRYRAIVRHRYHLIVIYSHNGSQLSFDTQMPRLVSISLTDQITQCFGDHSPNGESLNTFLDFALNLCLKQMDFLKCVGDSRLKSKRNRISLNASIAQVWPSLACAVLSSEWIA